MSSSWCARLPRDVGVVLVAAGTGSRLGGAPKQYRQLAGVPMLLRSLRPFAAHPDVAAIVVVLAPADVDVPPPWLAAQLSPEGLLRLAAGGATRSASVMAGLSALPEACTVVLIHDAARPFVGPDVIDAVISEARSGRAAIAAVPVADTLKESSPAGSAVVRTVPRERLWRAGTPQGFPRAMLESAHRAAAAAGHSVTDDASAVELAGGEVTLVEDSSLNFKVTTADDLALAECWAARAP